MTASARPGPLLVITAVIFIVLGLALAGGGAWLVSLGGSWYYVVAGIGMLIAGALVWQGRRSAQLFLALLLFATLIWSVIEVKFDWWQLLPRLDIWFAAAVWLLLPFVDRRLDPPLAAGAKPRDAGKSALTAAVVLTAAVGVFSLFQDYYTVHGEVPAENMAATPQGDVAPGVAPNDWAAYGRSGYGDRYAPAAQITPANISGLKEAWTYHTGDFKGPNDPGEIANEVTPLKVN
ncbi:MAG: membrane-bound PQQ-dependent dehydrogenase, glucose/quinate/shikimate family, partial [Janthinobacterium sp.]